MFLFSALPVFVITERHLKVASYQHVYEVISLLIRLSMLDNRRDYNLLTNMQHWYWYWYDRYIP